MLEHEGRFLRLLASAKEAEVYLWEEGKVVRLLRRTDGRQQLEREAGAMAAVAGSGGPVPRVFELVHVAGRPGLVMERLSGSEMGRALTAKPWRAGPLGRVLGTTHSNINALGAPAGLPSMVDGLRRVIEKEPTLTSDLRNIALSMLGTLSEGASLCHGDFHPANVILDDRRGALVIDWPNACRGDHHGDVARTLLLLGYAQPPGVPPPLRPVVAAVRRRLTRSYLTAYRQELPIDMGKVRRWQVVWAARRFSEGLPGERASMEKVIRGRA